MAQLVIQFSMVVVGGLISMFGSLLGAILLTVLPELLRGFQSLQEITFGILLMVFVIFMPAGLAGFGKRWGLLPEEILSRNWRKLRKSKVADQMTPSDAVSPPARPAAGASE